MTRKKKKKLKKQQNSKQSRQSNANQPQSKPQARPPQRKIFKKLEKRPVVIEGLEFLLKIHYELRDTSRASIRGQNINIRIPLDLNADAQEQEIQRLFNWARGIIDRNKDKMAQSQPKSRVYQHGDILHVGAENFELVIDYHSLKRSYGSLKIVTQNHIDAMAEKNFEQNPKDCCDEPKVPNLATDQKRQAQQGVLFEQFQDLEPTPQEKQTNKNQNSKSSEPLAPKTEKPPVKQYPKGRYIIIRLVRGLSSAEEQETISYLLARLIGQYRLRYLEQKIHSINNKFFKQKIGKISFKNNKSNWGSCSSKGNINISTRLLFAPEDVLEYVCIHELAHLIELNHSPRFWDIVEKAMPDYKEKELWLKENGDQCFF